MTHTLDYSAPKGRDNREAFEIAAAHMLAQGKRAATDDGKCYYRGPDGTKCAIGALIPDEVYQPKWDISWSSESAVVFLYRDEQVVPYLPTSPGLATELQSVHDMCPPERWSEELMKLARRWGWEWTPNTDTNTKGGEK